MIFDPDAVPNTHTHARRTRSLAARAALAAALSVMLGDVCLAQPAATDLMSRVEAAYRRPLESLFWTLAGLGVTAIAALLWNMALRRKVRQQLAILQDGLEREHALEERYQELIENARDLYVTLDADGRITWINRAGETMTGFTRAELVGRPFGALLIPGHAAVPVAETPYQCEVEIVGRSGTRAVLEINWQPTVEPGSSQGAQGIARDITARKHAEVELRLAKDAAEASTRAKSSFLANMSHEIRTPMNGILGMTDLLLDSRLDPEQREYLDMVRSSASSLLTVINDVLDFSKIEAGKLQIDVVSVPLRSLLQDLLKSQRLTARSKGLALLLTVADDVPAYVVADPVRLRQIVLNLVGNALKFTSEGEVALEVTTVSDPPDGKVTLDFLIRDTGIGIAADKLEMIFEAFTQEDGSTTRQHGGTGLGLSISSRLAALMEGSLTVESTPGAGSRFHFIASFAIAEAPAPAATVAAAADAPRPPLHVLLVEDTLTNRVLATRLLEKQGHAVASVANGESALEILDRETFDVVLMDVQLPDMSGLEVTQRIRARERETGERLAIVAMTAHAISGARERCLEAGMDDYVTKPIALAELSAALRRVTPRSLPAAPAAVI